MCLAERLVVVEMGVGEQDGCKVLVLAEQLLRIDAVTGVDEQAGRHLRVSLLDTDEE